MGGTPDPAASFRGPPSSRWIPFGVTPPLHFHLPVCSCSKVREKAAILGMEGSVSSPGEGQGRGERRRRSTSTSPDNTRRCRRGLSIRQGREQGL